MATLDDTLLLEGGSPTPVPAINTDFIPLDDFGDSEPELEVMDLTSTPAPPASTIRVGPFGSPIKVMI